MNALIALTRFFEPKQTSNRNLKIWLLGLVYLFAILAITGVSAQNITIPSGSYIINMGVTPQTIPNGLRPYGMLYDLIKNHNVPVIWSIDPSKGKDGIDFSHNGIDYRGGPFIIPAEFRTTDVNARITYWQGQGVVGATTVSSADVPIFQTLRGAPRWTPDKKNGSIAVSYLDNAMIPSSAYMGASSNWKDPAELDCCDDLFIMPHADPIWSTHQNLIPWNLDCKGGIWAACHAVSALENMVNPADRDVQSNFLTVKDPAWKGTSGNYTLSNSLILWGSHSGGTPPYSYRFHTEPVAQFMGSVDAATQNGSEQIMMPRQGIVANASTYSASAVARWNPGAKTIVFDPTQVNVTNPDLDSFSNVASVMTYGRGYDDPNRGYVMYQPAHSHAKSTAPANVASQRAMLNFSFLVANEKVVLPTLSSIPAVVTSGVPVILSYDLPPGVDPADFTTHWIVTCGGTFEPNNTTNPTTYTPPAVSTPTPCVVSVVITDICGRTSFESEAFIVEPCELNISNTIINVLCNGNSDAEIGMVILGSPGPFSWNWSRVTPAGSGNGAGTTIAGLSAGTYNITVTDGGACTATFTQLITQPNVLTATPNITSYLCFGDKGAINLTVSGGTSPYTYTWTGPGGPYAEKDLSDLLAGTYNVTVTDANDCTATASAIINGPQTAVSVVLEELINVTCNGADNGSISVSASGGTPGYTYLWSDGSVDQNRTGLAAGVYTVTVTDANNCTATLTNTISQPAPLLLTISKTDPTCPPGANPPVLGGNGAIDLTVSGGSLPYTYDWADLAPPDEPEDRSGLPEGTYSVTVLDDNGCTANISVTLNALNLLPATPSGITNN